MRGRSWFVLLAVLVLAAARVEAAEEKRYQIPVGNSPSTGPADAPVTMFEFLDFQ